MLKLILASNKEIVAKPNSYMEAWQQVVEIIWVGKAQGIVTDNLSQAEFGINHIQIHLFSNLDIQEVITEYLVYPRHMHRFPWDLFKEALLGDMGGVSYCRLSFLIILY